LLTSTDRYN